MKLSLIKLFIFLLFISFFPQFILASNLRLIHFSIILLPLIQIIFRSKILFIRKNIFLILYPFSIFVSSFIGGALVSNLFFILDNLSWSIFSSIKFQYKLNPYKFLNYFSYATFLLLGITILIFLFHLIIYGKYYDLKEINGVRLFYGLSPLLLLIRINLRKYLYKKNKFKFSEVIMLVISLAILFLSLERKSIFSFLLSTLIFIQSNKTFKKLDSLSFTKLKLRFQSISQYLIFLIPLILIILLLLSISNNIIELLTLNASNAVTSSNISRLNQSLIIFDYLKENLFFGSPSLDFNEIMLSRGFDDSIASNIHGYYQRLIFSYGIFPLLLSFLPILLALKTIFMESYVDVFYMKAIIIFPIIVYILFFNFFLGGGSLSNILLYFPLIFSNIDIFSNSEIRYSNNSNLY